MSSQPLLSIVVVVFNMRREATRTLQSMTRSFQHQTSGIDYEVIVVDNGSSEPIDDEMVRSLGEHFRYYYLPKASVSPCRALNFGAAQAWGRYITACIDGARIWSPGILHHTALATRLKESPVITTLAWHLGRKLQNQAIGNGYNQEVEDQLLQNVAWKTDGYRLFEISCLAASSASGWFVPVSESNCLTVSRSTFETLGGFDERFSTPGGGFANLDYFKRASELPQSTMIVLLGEGTFHQFHGGVATNVPWEEHPGKQFAEEYERLRGAPFEAPQETPLYFGTVPRAALPFLQHSATQALEHAKSPL